MNWLYLHITFTIPILCSSADILRQEALTKLQIEWNLHLGISHGCRPIQDQIFVIRTSPNTRLHNSYAFNDPNACYSPSETAAIRQRVFHSVELGAWSIRIPFIFDSTTVVMLLTLWAGTAAYIVYTPQQAYRCALSDHIK